MGGISFDRNVRLVPQLWLGRDQRVKLVGGHFDLRLLMSASRSLENSPMRQRKLLLLLGRPVRRKRNAFAGEERGPQMANGIYASGDKRNHQDNDEDTKDEASLGETTRTLPRWRWLDPSLRHDGFCMSVLPCASINFSYRPRKPSDRVRA